MKQQTKKRTLSDLMGDSSSLLTVIGALLVEIVVFAILSPNFLTVINFKNIGLYAAIVGCVSCSVTLASWAVDAAMLCSCSSCSCWYFSDSIEKLRSVIFPVTLSSYSLDIRLSNSLSRFSARRFSCAARLLALACSVIFDLARRCIMACRE